MPVPKKQRTTSTANPLPPDATSLTMPSQQEFHQHLRTLAQMAVKQVIECVMLEELEALLAASWRKCTPKRKGYRNGSYIRDLITSTGKIEDVKVPRDRVGQFQTQTFERYSRFEPHIAEGLTQIFVSGTSTHKVGEVAQTLLGVSPSASTISHMNQTPTEQLEAWRERRLQEQYRILYLDGVHFSVRHGNQADSTITLTALGVEKKAKMDGRVSCRICDNEGQPRWM